MYCIKCGTQNSDEASFCQKCGHRFDNGEDDTRIAARSSGQLEPSGEPVFTITPTLKFVKAGYVVAVIAAFTFVALIGLLLSGDWKFIAIAIGILFLLVPAYFHLKQRMTRYTLTDTMIEIDRGLISRSTQSIPLRRIQDVTVTSTAVQRLLGFGDVVVDNASETGGQVILDNIDSPRKYANLLLEQMKRLEALKIAVLFMSTIFVTGGAGFIGSAFVRQVLEEQPDVSIINYDALTYAGNLENLKGLDETRHRFIKGDICDRQAVSEAIPEGCDAVFNFAAESHVDRSIISADEFLRTNIIGTQVLLDAARGKNVRRFVQISTDEVMGSLPDDREEQFTESSPLKPNSPYAASKASAELVVRAASETFGIDAVITRCGNNYGPRQFPEKLIPLMIANALEERAVPVYGDGRNVRDWIFVDDHCRAVWSAFEKGWAGEVYNIGARNERQNIEVVRSVLDALGKPHSLITFVTDRLGHDRRYAIDPEKTETELDWHPRVTWQDGLARTIEWYRNNQSWIEHIRGGEYRKYYESNYGVAL